MKFATIATAFTASTAVALSIPQDSHKRATSKIGAAGVLYTIELEPGVTQQVTEEEKWALKAVRLSNPVPASVFADIAS